CDWPLRPTAASAARSAEAGACRQVGGRVEQGPWHIGASGERPPTWRAFTIAHLPSSHPDQPYSTQIASEPNLGSRSLYPDTAYPREDEQRAEQERIRVAVERMPDAIDVGSCPYYVTEICKRQQVAGAVYTTPCRPSSYHGRLNLAEGGEGKITR